MGIHLEEIKSVRVKRQSQQKIILCKHDRFSKLNKSLALGQKAKESDKSYTYRLNIFIIFRVLIHIVYEICSS